jgi:hypothetical protein
VKEEIKFKKIDEFCQKIIYIVSDDKSYWNEDIIILSLIKALESFISVRLDEVSSDDRERIAGLFFLISSQIDLRILSKFYFKCSEE